MEKTSLLLIRGGLGCCVLLDWPGDRTCAVRLWDWVQWGFTVCWEIFPIEQRRVLFSKKHGVPAADFSRNPNPYILKHKPAAKTHSTVVWCYVISRNLQLAVTMKVPLVRLACLSGTFSGKGHCLTERIQPSGRFSIGHTQRGPVPNLTLMRKDPISERASSGFFAATRD